MSKQIDRWLTQTTRVRQPERPAAPPADPDRTFTMECDDGDDCACADLVDGDLDLMDAEDCSSVTLITEYEGYTLRWSLHGRLGDVCGPDGAAIDCVQVCDYDWSRGEPVPNSHRPHAALKAWVDENGGA